MCILLVGKTCCAKELQCNKSVLSDERIKQFQELCKIHLGKEISREEAYAKAVKLIRLVELTYKPMTQSEYDALQKRRGETRI